MSQNQTPSVSAIVAEIRPSAEAYQSVGLAATAAHASTLADQLRLVDLDVDLRPMTDDWLQKQFAGALTVAKLRFGETEAGRAAVLRGFANRILLGQADNAEQRAAALAVPFTENPAEPPAEAAAAAAEKRPELRSWERACSNCAHDAADALAEPCHGCAGFGDPDSGPSRWEPTP